MIHRYWQGPPPPRVYELPGVIDWTRTTLPPWIADLIDRTAPHVTAERQHQHAANVARTGLLWQYGGMWADHDLRPLGPWDDLPYPATAAHTDLTRCNCWLSFPKGHETVGRVLGAIEAATGPPRPAVDVSGERLWNRLCPPTIPRLTVTGWAHHERWTSGGPNEPRHP